MPKEYITALEEIVYYHNKILDDYAVIGEAMKNAGEVVTNRLNSIAINFRTMNELLAQMSAKYVTERSVEDGTKGG